VRDGALLLAAGAVATWCRRSSQKPACPLPWLVRRLGAYRGVGRENAVVKYSRHVLDALPKILTVQGGGETGAPLCLCPPCAACRLVRIVPL
jgi:hypothetical protein